MKPIKAIAIIMAISCLSKVGAQESETSTEASIDKKSYYQNRAMEDAKFEQQFTVKTKSEEEAFWDEQKAYENNLKQKDKKAYRAYMKGKKDAYANHYERCNHHCHHSDYYYHHASFYYYRYDGYYYDRYPRNRNIIGTNVRINTPSIRLGMF